MKNLGEAKIIMGMDIMICFKNSELFLSQFSYSKKVAEELKMQDAKIVNSLLDHHMKLSLKKYPQIDENNKIMKSNLYTSRFGSILYGMVYSRLNLAYAVSIVSRFMENPGQTLEWVLRYLNGYLKRDLNYTKFQEEDALEVFINLDYTSNVDNRKSQSSYVFMLFGITIRWKINQK